MKRICSVLASLALLSVAAHAAPSQRELARLDRLLAGVEHVPGADEIRRLGPGTDAALITYASDARASRLRRLRAVAALRFVPSIAAHAFLDQLVAERAKATDGADVLDLAAALGALIPYGHDALATELRYLTHASADVRQAAAAALGQLHEPDARGALAARLIAERDAGVHVAVERALHELDRPAAR